MVGRAAAMGRVGEIETERSADQRQDPGTSAGNRPPRGIGWRLHITAKVLLIGNRSTLSRVPAATGISRDARPVLRLRAGRGEQRLIPVKGETYRTLDMHTAGEPVRIVTDGYPALPGATILEKRRYAQAKLDHIRRRLMLEPRGHADMYGVIAVEPSHPEADLAVLFTHNSGYSTMCGHATIAIGRWAVEHKLVPVERPLTSFNLECPCGVVRVTVEVGEAGTGEVTFESVPAFASHLDLAITTERFGRVGLDIGFGGAFYAILPASRIGLSMLETPLEALIQAAREI